MSKKSKEDEIEVGDTVEIEGDRGQKVTGKVTCKDAFGTKGQYGIDDGEEVGLYSRSKDEIKKKK